MTGRTYEEARADLGITEPRYGKVRRHEHDGGVYAIRDVFTEGGSFMRCEYATASDDGVVTWTPCREGVSFDEIKPLGRVQYINVEKAS
ncbi:hypothetical protein [Sinorhizobium meliloti]|uniref:hypothetical protein n=1 Tax=Rhizobium meliloti TaxID=382 RepID=UPI000FDB9132|nr:hypothetical protein [Sinorhizobium meliloti]QGJ73804.1 hypothetical protein C3L21_07130 [Sinorhizobium meliloti]RVG89037.1 hypothetical protein CN218_26160 [Sinorhizobium meliloti]RVK89641.1 hypothetical protein CN150_30130 [Sinorhizobium meliloti]RVM15099.1 hypothetical protein CN134_15085 [Sinorhizobium meliloti]RVO28314.1 hypothetical protein CN098_21760 [Sinorhizobium meliloti]